MSRVMFGNSNIQALEWLEGKGIIISRVSYHTHLNKISATAKERLYEVAKEFPTLVERELFILKDIQDKLYHCYDIEADGFRKAQIAFKIAELQPYLTSLYGEIRNMIETNAIRQTNKILRESESI
jgi:hypothetical protein